MEPIVYTSIIVNEIDSSLVVRLLTVLGLTSVSRTRNGYYGDGYSAMYGGANVNVSVLGTRINTASIYIATDRSPILNVYIKPARTVDDLQVGIFAYRGDGCQIQTTNFIWRIPAV